jgi:hypothetical protein
MGVLKWVLVIFAVGVLGLALLAKVLAFLNPPRPGRPRPAALGAVERSMWWTVVWAAAVGVAVLVVAFAGG